MEISIKDAIFNASLLNWSHYCRSRGSNSNSIAFLKKIFKNNFGVKFQPPYFYKNFLFNFQLNSSEDIGVSTGFKLSLF